MITGGRESGRFTPATGASHVILFNRWWNPAVEAQAIARAHHIGQTKGFQVHDLTSVFSIEGPDRRPARNKRALAEAVLSGGETALTELTDAELADLITLGARA